MMRSSEPIGTFPPKEPFTSASRKKADEEAHVLFDHDSAEPRPSALKTLEALIADRRRILLVDIHGYASTEGDPTYNFNLAAHRAAAIQRLLLPLLPRGAQVELFSHGETDVWGDDLAANRRAGVHVWEPPAPTQSAFQLKPSLPSLTLKPLTVTEVNPELDEFGNPRKKPDLSYHPDPALVEPDPKKPAYDPFTLSPVHRPPGIVDWGALREPFTNRGIRLSNRDIDGVQDNWNRAYLWVLGLGFGPDTATMAANKLTSAAYDIQLAKEQPNFWDKVDQEDKRLGISKSPMVPIVTPETLKFVSKSIFKVDLDLRF